MPMPIPTICWEAEGEYPKRRNVSRMMWTIHNQRHTGRDIGRRLAPLHKEKHELLIQQLLHSNKCQVVSRYSMEMRQAVKARTSDLLVSGSE